MARLIDLTLALLVLWVVNQVVPEERVLARLVLGLGALTAYEALFVAHLRATPGKLATSLKVSQLDRDRIDQEVAWIRGVVTTISTVAVILAAVPATLSGIGDGWLPPALDAMAGTGPGFAVGGMVLTVAGAAVLAVVAFPLRRGAADRIAGTIVSPFAAPAVITSAEVAAGQDEARPRPVTAWGPVARPEARRRARAARLDDAPLLVVGLVAVILAWALDPSQLFTFLGLRVPAAAFVLVVAWAALLVVDETWRVARDGGTAGHRREGLVVVDEATGEAPARGKALARAVVLVVFWLFPPLLPVLALWVQLSRSGQGPHDLVAGTVVVDRGEAA